MYIFLIYSYYNHNKNIMFRTLMSGIRTLMSVTHRREDLYETPLWKPN
jgi:hypothetical protein